MDWRASSSLKTASPAVRLRRRRFYVMVVGGPEFRKDYHWDEARIFLSTRGATSRSKFRAAKRLTYRFGKAKCFCCRRGHNPVRGARALSEWWLNVNIRRRTRRTLVLRNCNAEIVWRILNLKTSRRNFRAFSKKVWRQNLRTCKTWNCDAAATADVGVDSNCKN